MRWKKVTAEKLFSIGIEIKISGEPLRLCSSVAKEKGCH
jgi:hypothetical protein